MTINSSKAFKFLKNVKTKNPSAADDAKYIERKKTIEKGFKTKVELSGMSSLLDIEFKSPIWDKWSEKCRYEARNEIQARELYEAVTDEKHGVLQWISQCW